MNRINNEDYHEVSAKQSYTNWNKYVLFNKSIELMLILI